MSQKTYVIYEPDGRIVQTTMCADTMVDMQLQGAQQYIEYSGDTRNMMVDTSTLAVVPLPDNPARLSRTTLTADSVDSIVIDGILAGSKVLVNGEVFDVNDGVFEFTVDMPGVYPVSVRSPLALRLDVEVTAQ